MAFCNWCQLESETEDTCVWCKRPLVKNFSVYAGRDAVSLLRDDLDSINDRAVGVIGACVGVLFFAVVVFAAVTYGGNKSTKTDPLSTVAESELTWSGERPTPPVSAPTPVVAYTPPPARTIQPAQQAAQAPSVPRSVAPNSVSVTAYSGVPAATALRDGESSPVASGVFIESAKISSKAQQNGKYTVEGKVYVTNVSGMRVNKLTFSLVVGDQSISLSASAIDLGHGMTDAFSVKAVDVDPDFARSPEARIQITASTSQGTMSDGLPLGG